MDHLTANDMKLNEIKTTIRGLLISSPYRPTEEQLVWDYKLLVGGSIPFRDFGYQSLNSFLRSMPDVVWFDGNVLLPVVLPKLAHVQKLVMSQVPPKPSGACKKPAVYQHRISPGYYKGFYAHAPSAPAQNVLFSLGSRFVPSVVQLKLYKILANYPEGVSLNDVDTLINFEYPLETFDIQGGTLELIELVPHLAKISRGRVFLAEGKRQQNQGVLQEEDENLNNPCIDLIVISNIQKILDKCPDGVWCSDLPTKYKESFGVPLNFHTYGYSSVVQMAADLPEVFHVLRPDFNEILLMDARKDLLPDFAKYNVFGVDYDQSDEFCATRDDLETIRKKLSSLQTEPHGAHVSDYEPLVLSNIIGSPSELPLPNVPIYTSKLEYMEVSVGDINNPSNFWVQMRDEDRKGLLKDLEHKMKSFYTRNKYIIPRVGIKPNQMCTFEFRAVWRRACILKAPDEYETEVFCIDYGIKRKVKLSNLNYLVKKFAALPPQAVKCSLMNNRPANGLDKWTPDATEWFQVLVMNQPDYNPLSPSGYVRTPKRLMGLFTSVAPRMQHFTCVLVDTSRDEDFHINDNMVSGGYAEFMSQ